MTSFTPPGPVSQAFFEAMDPISVLMGPVGSAKTTTGLWKGIAMAHLWPETRPGLRQVRFGIVRRLYKDLEKTTMASWNAWFPRDVGDWRGGRGDPATHDLVFPYANGRGRIEFRADFLAIGDQRIEEALRGYEPSYCYVDEVDTTAPNTLTWLHQRAGRYPGVNIKINPKMVWGTCNAPEEDNWIVEDFIDDPKPGHVLYRQPSGLSSQAENLHILGANYYHEMAKNQPAFERKRFIENIPGLSRNGEAVYGEFNPDWHVAPRELDPIPGLALIVGMDAGGTPAATCMQVAPNGQRRFLAALTTHEKIAGSITGPTRFGEALAELLARRFRGLRVRGLADPSAANGADRQAGESSWIEIVGRVAGIPVVPAPGNNDPTIRQEALRLPMLRLIDGRLPGLVVCPVHARPLIKALASDYKFAVAGGKRTTTIVKNWASHLVEGAQYGALDGGAFHEVMARTAARRSQQRSMLAQIDFNPLR